MTNVNTMTPSPRRAGRRTALAGLIVGLAATATLLVPATTMATAPCYAPTEDSSTRHCRFDPDRRYDYDAGWWRPTDRVTAPTGAELQADPDPADEEAATATA